MNFRLGFRIFQKNIVLNILIILQVSICLISSNVIIARQNTSHLTIDYIEDFPKQHTVLYMAGGTNRDLYRKDEAAYETYILSELSQYEEIESVEFCKFSSIGKGSQGYRIFSYGEKTAQYLNLPVKGKWFSKVPKVEGIINCVVIGDEKKFSFGNTFKIDTPFDETLTFKVVGSMGNSGIYFRTGFSMLDPSADRFFNTVVHDPHFDNNVVTVLCEQEYIAATLENANPIIYLKENLTDVEVNKFVEKIGRSTLVATFAQIEQNTKKGIKNSSITFLPLILSIALIGVAGLISLAILNTVRHMKTFSIFSICGMYWNDSIKICLSYVLFVVMGIVLFGGGIYAYAVVTDYMLLNNLTIGVSNIIFTLSNLLLVVVISIATPIVLIGSQHPLQVFRKS